MAAVLGGLGAALIWSVGTAFASRAARALGPPVTLAWVMLVGLVALALVLPWAGDAHLSVTAIVWLVLGGAGNVAGLLILYHALRIGQMGVVMPIVSTEGGIAAVLSIIAGQPVSTRAATALAMTVLGVMMTAIARRPSGDDRLAERPPEAMEGAAAVRTPRGRADRRAALWAAAGAVSMGISLFGTGRAGAVLPTAWAVMPPRVIGVVAITIPLALRRQLRFPAAATRQLLVAGLCEVGGFFAYAAGARHGIAVAAVLATLTGAIGAGFGRLLFGERLAPTQVIGVIVIFAGVATLTAITA
ncbi:MAG TPA: EamA family transporter [Solirubrobacteraceae bacterium]|jgi:drug/metabolite transporter (DMT)-like permease|nr:EamA family transporter [Solirubrobacteraceae bacterium]